MRRNTLRWRVIAATAAGTLIAMGLVGGGGPASSAVLSGFETSDGNLAPVPSSGFDWNSFATVAWPSTIAAPPPYRIMTPKTVGGWELNGFEDAATSGSDTAFSGGTKQNDDCATLKDGPKPPNKDDLMRIYLSYGSKAVGSDNHFFLNLAWVRIPQNTTSSSAHIAFEFNKATSGACDSPNQRLKKRVAGDMLVVYDFEGGDADNPTLKMSRWLVVGGTDGFACEVGSRPCWGNTQDLTALGFAEAKVNTTSVGTVSDAIRPPGAAETLGLNEFGEAGIDLTAAGVFGTQDCTAFGSAYAVSRSSGSSAQAQMKDIVGPGPVNINNCGALRIVKQSTKSGNPLVSTAGAEFSVDGPDTGTAYDFRVVDNTTTAATSPAPPRVADETADVTTTTPVEGIGELCVSGLAPGSYSVTETAPPTGYGAAPAASAATAVTVVTGTNCTTAKPADTASGVFLNPPLADIQVRFRDGGSGETSLVLPVATNLTCVDGATTPPALGGTVDRTGTTGWDDTLTITGIAINPSPRTIVCTIVIDP